MSESQRTSTSGLHLQPSRFAGNQGHSGREAREAREVRITDCYPFNDVDVTDPADIVRNVIDAAGIRIEQRSDNEVIATLPGRRCRVPSAGFRRFVQLSAQRLTGEEVCEGVLFACESSVSARATARRDKELQRLGIEGVLAKVRDLETKLRSGQ